MLGANKCRWFMVGEQRDLGSSAQKKRKEKKRERKKWPKKIKEEKKGKERKKKIQRKKGRKVIFKDVLND